MQTASPCQSELGVTLDDEIVMHFPKDPDPLVSSTQATHCPLADPASWGLAQKHLGFWKMREGARKPLSQGKNFGWCCAQPQPLTCSRFCKKISLARIAVKC